MIPTIPDQKPVYRIYLISAVIVVLDQITKWMVKSWMYLYESIPLIGDSVRLTFVENPGMAFGVRFFHDHAFLGRWFFTIVSFGASIALIWYIHKMRYERGPYRAALGLILGGAVGNLIDRFLYGRVVDFMDVDIPDMLGMQRWPVFNVADSAVVCGMVIITFMILFTKPAAPHEKKKTNGSGDIPVVQTGREGSE